MSILTNAVEVCDLKHGRIEFGPEAAELLAGSHHFEVTVTDRYDIAHDLRANAVETTLNFDATVVELPIRSLRISKTGESCAFFEAPHLFPSTDTEFESQFKSHRDRSGNRYTDFFVASQIFNHFTGQEGYRLSAAVVAAYKAIEILKDPYLAEAEDMLLRSLSTVPTVKLERSTRNNREHLHISLLCALYHVYLARNNPEAFVSTLIRLKELLENNEFKSYYNLAYNSALSLRLLTLLQLMAGRPKAARTTARRSFDLFKLAARDADGYLAHFKELRYVHDNTYETMRMARKVKDVSEVLIDKTLQGCLRISNKDHPRSVERMKGTFRDSAAHITERTPNDESDKGLFAFEGVAIAGK